MSVVGKLPTLKPTASPIALRAHLQNKLINMSRAASNVECTNEASKNPRRLWSTIKSLLHSSPPSEQLSPSISQPLANSLATFFCNKIVALKESISLKLRGSPSPFDFDQPHSNELLSDFTPVTPAEVSKLLQSMSNKSSQLDYIPTSLVKSLRRDFLHPHFRIWQNLSFTQATFPSKFKLALISPLLKKPGLPKSELSNFRPISNLNTIGKMLERLALAHLFPHISISPSFCPLQSAYRKFHSTETALLKLTNDIMETIDSGKNNNSDCSWHVGCIWYSQPYHTSPQTSAYFRSVRLCHLLGSLLSD